MPRMQDVDPERWKKIQEGLAKKNERDRRRHARVIREAEAVLPSGIRPEHNYAHGSMEQWERAVFNNAQYFAVCRAAVGQPRYRKDHKSFREAYDDAMSSTASLLYAVTESGRSTLIERKEWDHCLTAWTKKGTTP